MGVWNRFNGVERDYVNNEVFLKIVFRVGRVIF